MIVARIYLLAGMSPNATHVCSVPRTTSCACLLSDNNQMPHQKHLEGGRATLVYWADIKEYVHSSVDAYDDTSVFNFVEYADRASSLPTEAGFIVADVPLVKLIPYVTVAAALKIARAHHISIGSHVPKSNLYAYFEGHDCLKSNCKPHLSISATKGSRVVKKQPTSSSLQEHNIETDNTASFPPPPLSTELTQRVMTDFCNDSSKNSFEEAGCAVCGQLINKSELTRLKSVKGMLNVLAIPGITRVERKSSSEKIKEFAGPVLDYECNMICTDCRSTIRKGKIPNHALANGLWIGKVPKALSELRFIEKLLIARLRHNCCFVRVASGMRKMTSHVVAFQAPIRKMYNILPPPVEDLDEVLAILFTGPSKPTTNDFARTPLLVRRNAVAIALEWLELNHADYSDIEISYENLAQYPEDSPPVSVEYKKSADNKYPENTSVFDDEVEDGTQEGDCPFVVHGLTGENLDTMTNARLKGIALSYLNNGGKMLAVGHSENPESIYNNPQFYPQMFPWLFPYGHGGIGSTHLSDAAHKQFLLMYHDKRFQTDVYFPFVAFSHAQIKSSTTGAF